MKRNSRLHNRAPSTFAFRKPYEFAAISIRWQKTFSYIQSARSYSTSGKTITTPNFGTIPMPEVGSLDAHHQELSNVKIEGVNEINIAALRGPWLMIFPGTESNTIAKQLPSGELMIEGNGIVYFRPGSDLGYGVGRIDLSSDGNFSMTLETYLYEQTSKFPPNESENYTFRGVVQRALIGSHNTAIFTFNGRATHLADQSCSFQFQAAKMDGWSEETHKASAFQPDLTLTQNLERIIPPMASFPSRPKLDLSKHKVGDLPNIYYVSNWVSPEEEETMLKILKATPKEAKQQLDRRLVQEYGGSMCTTCNTSFVSEGNIPTWCTQVCDGLTQTGVFTPATFPNNVRIHEYESNEGIGPHVDGPIYVPVVAILSLASSCVMSFYPRREPYDNPMDHYNDTFKFDGEIAKQKPICSIVLEPRSLLVFSHDVYWYHPHGIRAESVDSLTEAESGPIVNSHLLQAVPGQTKALPRTYRVGVTIRNLLPRCNHQPTRAEYFMGEAFRKLHGVPKAPEMTEAVQKPLSSASKAKKSVPIAPEPPKPRSALPKIRASAGESISPRGESHKVPIGSSSSGSENPQSPSPVNMGLNPPTQPMHPLQPNQMPTPIPAVEKHWVNPVATPPAAVQPTVQGVHPAYFSPPLAAPPAWGYPYPGYPQYSPYYPPPMPLYPMPMAPVNVQPPQQCVEPTNVASAAPSHQHAETSQKFTELSSKLSGILNKIDLVEKSVTRLESTVETIKSAESSVPSDATNQILQGLIQSHMRLKEDHGEILDRVCKAVVETNHMVKRMPKDGS